MIVIRTVNETLGTNFTSSAEITAAISSGQITDGQVASFIGTLTSGMNDRQLAQFDTILATATGVRTGNVGVSGGQYVNIATGENMAGMWNRGVVGERSSLQNTYDLLAGYGNGINPYAGVGSYTLGVIDTESVQSHINPISSRNQVINQVARSLTVPINMDLGRDFMQEATLSFNAMINSNPYSYEANYHAFATLANVAAATMEATTDIMMLPRAASAISSTASTISSGITSAGMYLSQRPQTLDTIYGGTAGLIGYGISEPNPTMIGAMEATFFNAAGARLLSPLSGDRAYGFLMDDVKRFIMGFGIGLTQDAGNQTFDYITNRISFEQLNWGRPFITGSLYATSAVMGGASSDSIAAQSAARQRMSELQKWWNTSGAATTTRLLPQFLVNWGDRLYNHR